MDIVDRLLDSDPAIRWQVLRDLTDADDDEVARERARVATEGWGAQILARRDADGQWGGGAHFPKTQPTLPGQPWTSTAHALTELRLLGLDPASIQARQVVDDVRRVTRWEYDDLPFWEGEVEPCINGRLVSDATYFGVPVDGVIERLLGDQMADGGWNCDQERGSTIGSVDTSISVLEALAAVERAGGDERVRAARERGEEYLLERRLLWRKRTGEPIDDDYFSLAYPRRWRYDLLWALEHFAGTRAAPDRRMEEAIELLRQKQQPDGWWLRDIGHGGDQLIDYGAVGEPSSWITLRALTVLRWADGQPVRR